MGFGKYTKDERKIVHKISVLLIRQAYHKRMQLKFNEQLKDSIDLLGGKYQRKE